MRSLSKTVVAVATAMIAGGCRGDPSAPMPLPPEAVQLSIWTDPSQPMETCGEIRVDVTATRGHRPLKGLVVNFVPLAGSVFAAAVATNKDGMATTYWNLGAISQTTTKLIARAVDEDGTRVLDDTLEVTKRQKPFMFAERFFFLYRPEVGLLRRLELRAPLWDACLDPIPDAPVTATYSGPVESIDPSFIEFRTLPWGFPDDRQGEAWVGFRFSDDVSLPNTGYQIILRSVEVPSVTLTVSW